MFNSAALAFTVVPSSDNDFALRLPVLSILMTVDSLPSLLIFLTSNNELESLGLLDARLSTRDAFSLIP